ncbi:MAG: PQQ-like beta-propeller repeat protein [Candidatus Thermoplasmatota archaeon]|nr:PQQ-like beta-propeller repeat protein [Candidatus Thermoplasmatota archaeon]
MKLLRLKINLVSIITISLLVFSNLFVLNVTADLKQYPDEGLYYDDFSNENNITKTGCVYDADRNCFYLTQGSPLYNYNYANAPNSIGMWETNWSFLSKDTLIGTLNQFLKPDSFTKENEITKSVKLQKLSAIDNKTISTASSYFVRTDYSQYPVHRFRIKIDQDPSNIEKLTVRWWFGNYQAGTNFDNLKEISMYIWAYNTLIPRWINPTDLNTIYNPTTIGRVYGGEKLPDITYIDDGKYISEDGYLDFLIIGKPIDEQKRFELLTDYIDISVETIYGYMTSGSLISGFIEPSNFSGWESVIWSSSRYSNRSGVTISILDKDSKEIEGYSGKYSPLDISGIKNNKIRLKATFHSTDPKFTPYMFNWGVFYQKGSEYIDSFSNDYKIDEMLGTEIKNSSVVVSNYYGQWPFFGKNSDNTRFYQGPNIESGDAKVYWYSNEYNIAGGYRSPVTSEGKIYVASIDKKIYAYNILKNLNSDTQRYIDVSNELSTVETSLGIYEDYLILATGETGGKNKIYALNKNNLKQQLWPNPYPLQDDTICFSSNPTIDEDRLFITSWGGNIWDTAYFSLISRFLGGNNKIIAIDIKTGNELWEPITLPTGSISSPAVGNGLVYVGCQNMSGASLFAFDTETGDQIWSSNLGIIGRSSPVYADEKVFVLSNKKQNISSIGTYMLTAVNANNGKTLWNKSIGEFKTSSLINIIKGLNFTYQILEGFAPISTPAYKDGTLFVLSPNGTFLAIDTNNNGSIKWYYNITNPLIDLSYHITSPVVVGDRVYIISGDSVLYAFKTEYTSGLVEPVWSMEIGTPGYGHYENVARPDILASPIISDNMVIISATYDTTNLTGHLICIGDYTQNFEGTIKSTNIHVPTGKWWNKLYANITSSTKNKVVFKILDEDDKALTDWFSNPTSGYNLSNIDSNVIKLYAKLSNTDKTQVHAALNSWTIDWVDEKVAPIFNITSFVPGVDGWISSNLTECSIKAIDKADKNIMSGLDIDSAKYRIGYIEKNTDKKKLSDWIKATSSASSGANEARIVANLKEHGLNIKNYVNITFVIKDLAGNQGYSSIITFKTDTTKPKSDILNKQDFQDSYNTLVPVKAKGNDTGTIANTSGIRYVSLIYQYSKDKSANSWSNWQYYGDNITSTTYTWEFGENLKSGYYKILTIALDKAGNEENVSINKIVEFFFDNIDPIIKNKFNSEYKTIIIPSFNLQLYDDYSLENLYYRLDNETDYKKVVFNKTEDIKGKQDITVKWMLPDDKWADFKEDEEHYIYFKLDDTAGNNIETTKSNTPKVIKDENISQLNVDLTDFSKLKLGDTYTVKANIPSDIKVDKATLFYQYSKDNSKWSIIEQVGDDITSPPYKWSFTASNGSGYYKFYTKIIDASGIEYTSDSEIVNVTLIPYITLVLVIIAIIFVLFTIFIIRKMKKR